MVKAYPGVTWSIAGLRPLRAALISCVGITAVGCTLSNPLFIWANGAGAGTQMLQKALAASSLPIG